MSDEPFTTAAARCRACEGRMEAADRTGHICDEGFVVHFQFTPGVHRVLAYECDGCKRLYRTEEYAKKCCAEDEVPSDEPA